MKIHFDHEKLNVYQASIEFVSWADAAEHSIDCENRPVHRLRLWSPPLRAFELRTDFSKVN